MTLNPRAASIPRIKVFQYLFILHPKETKGSGAYWWVRHVANTLPSDARRQRVSQTGRARSMERVHLHSAVLLNLPTAQGSLMRQGGQAAHHAVLEEALFYADKSISVNTPQEKKRDNLGIWASAVRTARMDVLVISFSAAAASYEFRHLIIFMSLHQIFLPISRALALKDAISRSRSSSDIAAISLDHKPSLPSWTRR